MKVIDINKDRVQCAICDCWFNQKEITGFDDDGNQFCKVCVDSFGEDYQGYYMPVNE